MNLKISPKGIIAATNGFVKAHGHEILAGIGISSFVTSIVLAVKVTPTVQKDICKAEEEKGESLTKIELIKVAGKHYIPAIIAATSGAVCVIGATVLENKKVAAVATICQLTEDNLRDFKAHVAETIGEKKTQSIIEETAAKKVEGKDFSDDDMVSTKYGESIFYDPWSARFFGCTKDRVEKAVNAINLRLTGCDFVALNEFYDEIGIPNTQFGNYCGWTTGFGEILHMSYGYGPVPDGRSCSVLDYTVYMEDSIRKLTGARDVIL